ncbi:MAG: VWA domain-containing protein [Archangiaceae bacterium]|nr:VWA domain-containing protein [Archangiaceae bacterium]
MRTALIAFSLSTILGCQCSGTGAQCKVTTECGQAGVCLPIGTCAAACSATDSSSCVAGEKCSKGGGCVPATGCGADPDCSTGALCQVGTCGAPCSGNSCGAGMECHADGHCALVPQGGTGGGDSCGGELFQSTHVQANFLIVLDHSGSMMEKINTTAKWDLATAAVKQVTTQYQSQIRFGLSMFSTPTNCDPGSNFVPVGDGAAAAISGALPVIADGKGTPIGGALRLAAMHPGLMDPARANFVMLVTDGKENCQGNPVSEVKALAAANIKTFVVGFGSDVDAQMLSNMAINGGTARNTTPRYYQADDQATLNAAFNTIAQGAIGCDFKLSKAPPDPSKIFVYVNGQPIPRDPMNKIGWNYNGPANDRITLYGTVCDAVANNASAKVQIVYGCPDPTLVEGGGDGGTIDLDAGIIIN